MITCEAIVLAPITKAPVMFGGLGLAALGVKVNDSAAKAPAGKPAKAK